MTEGWVKLHRQILDSSLWQNPNAFMVFTYLLLRAAHTSKKFPFNGQDMELHPGELISSHDSIRIGLTGSLSTQQVRTALEYLKSTGRITSKSTNKFSIISITNWDEYQSDNKQDNKRATNEQQASNKPVTTNKNVKNEKNEENEKKIRNPLTPFEGEIIFPSNIDTPKCREEWNRWLTEKHAKRKGYKTRDSMETELRRLAKQLQTPERFCEAIDFSIGKNYTGVFEEMAKKQGYSQPNGIVTAPDGKRYSANFVANMELLKRVEEEERNEQK